MKRPNRVKSKFVKKSQVFASIFASTVDSRRECYEHKQRRDVLPIVKDAAVISFLISVTGCSTEQSEEVFA